MITPLYKAILTSSIKKSDIDHSVNKPQTAQILIENDFTKKKYLSKSYDAQIGVLRAQSRLQSARDRQIKDFRNVGNYWRLEQRRLLKSQEMRRSTASSSKETHTLIDHFPQAPETQGRKIN